MGKCFQGQGAFFVPPGSSRLTHSPTPSLYDHTLSRQRQFGNLRWLPKIKSRQFFSEHFMLSFWAFLAVFSFALPRVGHCVPWLLLRPLPRLQGSSGGRKGKVKSGRSLVVYTSPLLRLNCTTLLHSLHALLFLHFQQYRVCFF